MAEQTANYFKKDFWTTENRRYTEPHFRLQKIARIVNGLAGNGDCDLLDVGCGPAALAQLLDANIRYYGIDIAIQQPAPNLLESDFVEGEISYEGRTFDFIVASGLFEYMGTAQDRKLAEIHRALRPTGTFVVSYINFEHIHRIITSLYNNIQSIDAFRSRLGRTFHVQRSFPVSYNWHGTAPRRAALKALELRLDMDIPVLGRFFGVEYLFLCTPRTSRQSTP